MTTTEAPVKPKRKPRRGPPGVPCPSCGKIAGAEDEGKVESHEVSASGNPESVTVSLDDCTLTLTTACCSTDYKTYDLSGNEVSQDHECPVLAAVNEAEQAYNDHLDTDHAEDSELQPDPCDTEGPGVDCEQGQKLWSEWKDKQQEIDTNGDEWTVEDEGEPEPYQRYQEKARIRKTGKEVSIKSSRYRKSWRGVTLTVGVRHDLCGETVEVEFNQGDAETESGAFDTV